jgi:prepilin signal peptidase PulO-like enzyme (type II secretory pathway)
MDGFPNSTKTGTLGGTLLVVIIQIDTAELLKTAVLAAVGAGVSFCVTVLLKWVIDRLKSKGK